MPKLFVNDGGTVRRLRRLFVNDGGTVRELKKLFADSDGVTKEIFSYLKYWDVAGQSNELYDGVKEVVDFGVDDSFGSGTGTVPTFSISNTDESIPAITGSFVVGGDASQARGTLRTALEGDAEFSSLFSHTKDTEYVHDTDLSYTATKSTDGLTTDFANSGLSIERKDVFLNTTQATGSSDTDNVGGMDVTVTDNSLTPLPAGSVNLSNGVITVSAGDYIDITFPWSASRSVTVSCKDGSCQQSSSSHSISFAGGSGSAGSGFIGVSYGVGIEITTGNASDWTGVGVTGLTGNAIGNISGNANTFALSGSLGVPNTSNEDGFNSASTSASGTVRIYGKASVDTTITLRARINLTYNNGQGRQTGPTTVEASYIGETANAYDIKFVNNNPFPVTLGAGTKPSSLTGTYDSDGGSDSEASVTDSDWAVVSSYINDTGTASGYAGGFSVDVTSVTSISASNASGSGASNSGVTVSIPAGAYVDFTVRCQISTEDTSGSGTRYNAGIKIGSTTGLTNVSVRDEWVRPTGTLSSTNIYSTSGPFWSPIQRTSYNCISASASSNNSSFGNITTSNGGTYYLHGGSAVIDINHPVEAREGMVSWRFSGTPNTTNAYYQVRMRAYNPTSSAISVGFTRPSFAILYSLFNGGVMGTNFTLNNANNGGSLSVNLNDISFTNLNDTDTPISAASTGGARTFSAGQTVQVQDDGSSPAWTIAYASTTVYDFLANNPTSTTADVNGTTVNAGDTDVLISDNQTATSLGVNIKRAPMFTVARYTADSESIRGDFVYSITKNGGNTTTPHLDVHTEGEDPVYATVVNVGYPNEVISLTTGSSEDSVGQQIVNAVDHDEFSYDADTNVLTTPGGTNITLDHAEHPTDPLSITLNDD